MSRSLTQPQGVHLVGSIPLNSSAEVFKAVGSMLGSHVRRVPDGETAERSNWIGFQFPILASIPQLETVPVPPDRYPPIPQVKLREGASLEDIVFGELGYSAAAASSYTEFARLKQEGRLPEDCRFQVCLPTPLAPIHVFVVLEDQAAIEPVYEARLLEELEQILAEIPHADLAIQWDTAVEFALLEGIWPTYLHDVREEIVKRLIRLGKRVPQDVELGYHLCYGDSEHKHFVEPKDTSLLVSVANAIVGGLDRAVDWIHLPVPRDRSDEAYYAPLADLDLAAETELYLGLVHYTDGVAGTQERIESAKKIVPAFGVATECGFGRRPEERIAELMEIHTQVASPLR